MAKYSAVASIK